MKFIVAGQKKEPWFYKKKNRIIYAVIASLLSPFVLSNGGSYDWKSTIWTLILFAGFELLVHRTNKEEKAEGMISLEFLDDTITMKFMSGDVVEIPHNQIQAIHKDVTKIVIDVKNKEFVYSIPYSFFSYNDLQKIKKEVDRISEKISTQ